jgi:gliding motility-associated lipoprotein GldD
MSTMQIKFLKISIIIVVAVLLGSCNDGTIPRPYGYFRVDLPKPEYRTLDTLNLPYQFEISKYATMISRNVSGEKFWIDLDYPKLNASVYCSYKPVKNNLLGLLEDSRKIVYKHSVKADGISEKFFENKEKKVYGIFYDLKGNTASSVQFVLTDSVHHFFRGSLYFNNVPNKDSIAPMSDFIRADLVRLMESFEWKK